MISKVFVAGVIAVSGAAAHASILPAVLLNDTVRGVKVEVIETPVTNPAHLNAIGLGNNLVTLDFIVTSQTGLVSMGIEAKFAGGTIYNETVGNGGSDFPVTGIFLNFFPHLAFDSHVDLPGGGKTVLGRLAATGNAIFGPDTFDANWGNTGVVGAQTNFRAARITIQSAAVLSGFSGEIQVADAQGGPPAILALVIPEPASLGLMGVGSLLIGMRRRSTRN